ncbi:MAG TPA: reverse transcriptase domain-containing protein [Labilithrix sp.]|nr:reverse transcriptase domain-containing protein [Labilithrix sp.]
MSFTHAVADRARIERQLDRLAARAEGRRLDTLVQDGVRFAQLLDDRDRVIALVARALGDASYRPGAARVARVLLGGKPREIARVGALDLVAHAVVADVMAEAIEPSLSPCLWSYRAGRSSWQALRAVARYVARHRRQRPDPRTRGLYVLRSDVRAYTDEIPVDDGASLWREIDEALSLREDESAMVRALVRPEIASADGALERRSRGVLFGLPTTTVVANLYLRPLDRALEALGGMYARFGDDVLFASERPELVREARATLERVLAERGLAPNQKKLRVLHWNGAGRSSESCPEAEPNVTVPFLGGAVQFDGTIALPTEKWSAMLHDVRTRIRRTARLAAGTTESERAKLLATIANDAFDVRSGLGLPHAQLVADLVSDRAQLRQLDHLVALWIAEAVTGERGPRALRLLPPRRLRSEAGLASRVVARNHGRSS